AALKASQSTGSASTGSARPARAEVDLPAKTFDGFTLYTCVSDKDTGTKAFLINMQRQVVHRWEVDVGKIRHGRHGTRQIDPSVCFFSSYLYPNGDLLVVLRGFKVSGLLKLDAESNVLWFRSENIHHDVDVAEDGTIYAVEKKACAAPPDGLERIPGPCTDDRVLAFSPDGELLREPISLLKAFADSPYAALLSSLEEPNPKHQPPPESTAPRVLEPPPQIAGLRDTLHTNCVRELPRKLASKFPAFEAGQILVSLRNPSVLAMLDPFQGHIVWATRGPWLAQHDPQFLDNGHLLIFDNLGSPSGSRVLEYDPQTRAIPWSYSGTGGSTFYTSERGMNQRLPNGNTFILDTEGGTMIEAAPDGEPVWSYSIDRVIASARRYAPEQLHFLPPGTHARP
ncbi:MAG: arylsulfotransferase family protein, partial [Pirellulales bacterium]